VVRSWQVNLQKWILCDLPSVSKAIVFRMPSTGFFAIRNDAGADRCAEKQSAGLIHSKGKRAITNSCVLIMQSSGKADRLAVEMADLPARVLSA
jgi:hypothetical protein